MNPADALARLATAARELTHDPESSRDARVEAVVRDFASASEEERRAFRDGLAREHRSALFAWAGHRGATAGLRAQDPEQLVLGLVALSLLAAGDFDGRDALAVVPLYKEAATRIGTEPARVFDDAMARTDAPGRDWLLQLRDTPWAVDGGNYQERLDAEGPRFESAYPDFDAKRLEAKFGEDSPGAKLPPPSLEPSRWRDRIVRVLRLR